MNKEEAIGTMNYLKYYAETDTTERNVLEEKDRVRFIEAVEMAIKALSQMERRGSKDVIDPYDMKYIRCGKGVMI